MKQALRVVVRGQVPHDVREILITRLLRFLGVHLFQFLAGCVPLRVDVGIDYKRPSS